MINKFDDTVFSNDDIVFANNDSGNFTFSSGEMGILSVDHSNSNIFKNLDNVTFDENDPETIIHVILMACCNRFKQRKTFEKD